MIKGQRVVHQFAELHALLNCLLWQLVVKVSQSLAPDIFLAGIDQVYRKPPIMNVYKRDCQAEP